MYKESGEATLLFDELYDQGVDLTDFQLDRLVSCIDRGTYKSGFAVMEIRSIEAV